MSLRARMFLGLMVAAALAGAAPQLAAADVAAPLIVPAPDSGGTANATETPACQRNGGPFNDNTWLTCLLPDHDAIVDWPDQLTNVWPAPRTFILPRAGLFAAWLGEVRTEIGRPLIWYDVGSGIPLARPSAGYEFPLAGKYAWECLVCSGTIRTKLQGTMYVVGPRAMVNYSRVSPDNSGSTVTYGFDASGSFVADYTPHSIVEYSFDFTDDGIYDQTSPEPTGQATYAPGPHTMRVRVKTDDDRYAEYPLFFEIPYVRPGTPGTDVPVNTKLGNINSGVKFPATKIRLTSSKRIKVSVLRGKGLVIKLSGLTKGDRIKARLMYGKKTVIATGNGTATSAKKTIRLRVGKTGKRILKRKKRPKRLVIDVAIEGSSDGFTTTKRLGVRIT